MQDQSCSRKISRVWLGVCIQDRSAFYVEDECESAGMTY